MDQLDRDFVGPAPVKARVREIAALLVEKLRRDDLAVILAGYADRVDRFFSSNPGFRSRIAHDVDYADYAPAGLMAVAELMLREQSCRHSAWAKEAFARYIEARMTQPNPANARSILNALDRAHLRQALRLFEERDRPLTPEDLMTNDAPEFLASRVLKGGLAVGAEAPP